MSLTDPVADFLARIRNAIRARHQKLDVPASKLKTEIARILKEEGYVSDFEIAPGEVQAVLTVTLKYGRNRERSLAGVRRISKPGLRVYAKSNQLPKVLGGLGVAIISTSQGLLTDKEANHKSVGGEVIAFVW